MKQAIICSIFFSLLIYYTACKQKDTNPKKSEVSDRFEKLIPPVPSGWVSDFENVFTLQQAGYLDTIIGQHEQKTSNEIAVVTLHLDSISIRSSKEFDELSLALFNRWGVGKEEQDNGIGILFCVHLRKIRIEVGYGLEAKLTDDEAKHIIDTLIVPEFKKNNYFTGIVNALERIFKETE